MWGKKKKKKATPKKTLYKLLHCYKKALMSKYVIFVMLILTQISVPHPQRVYKLTIHILHTDYTYYYISF